MESLETVPENTWVKMYCPCPQGDYYLGEKTDMSTNSYNSGNEFLAVVQAKQYGTTEEEVSDYLDTKLGPKGKTRTQQRRHGNSK